MHSPPSTPSLAAFYRRVSTAKQDDSLELQEARTLQYGALHALTPHPDLMFADPDTSGRTPMRDRTGGRALLNRLKLGDVKHLVIAKLDRLGRNVRDALSVIEELKQLHVTLHIFDLGGESISTQGHIGRLVLTVLLAVAEWEVEEIRDRTTKQMRAVFDRGGLTGNVPFGYDCLYTFADGATHTSGHALSAAELSALAVHPVTSKALVDNPAEQETIRYMARLRGEGMPLRVLAATLNEHGLLTKQGKPWQTGHVDSILNSRHTQRLLQASALAAAA